jgi:alkanesulfonate monooxygenase SsuD/methylene tetrahydromethanopterin reductase-like flavin-dependent oxidoreductase (luciferase family)
MLREPHAMVAVATLVADSTAEAERLTRPAALQFIRLRSGHPGPLPSLEEAEAYPWTDGEREFAASRIRHQAVGTLPEVRAAIDGLAGATQADEVIVVPQGPTVEHRLRTLRELAPDAA